MRYELVERSSGYWIVNSLESGGADHPIFDLQPYVELDEIYYSVRAKMTGLINELRAKE